MPSNEHEHPSEASEMGRKGIVSDRDDHARFDDASEYDDAPGSEDDEENEEREREKEREERRKRRRERAKERARKSSFLKKTSVSDEVVIKFDHVKKTYKLYRSDRARFLDLIGIRRRGKKPYTLINANDDISFEIKRGEGVAFFGHNGAGKSTALKIITGVSHQTEGDVEVNGNVSALLELNAGFDGRLTGRENIDLRSQIMGYNRDELAQLAPKIVEFADLGVYIDQPMKTYSSGMKARLGFAFAVSVDPEILVVDEALSVGDRAFKKKCVRRMREIMMDENVTVLFVTHATASAEDFCSRGIVLDKGKKVFDGPIEDATDYYEDNY